MHARSAALLVVVVFPLLFVAFPIGLAGAPDPPDIPDGVVQATEPQVGAVGIPETAFDTLTGVDSGGVIDPATGQPKIPVYVGVDGERITPDRIEAFLEGYDSPMAPRARTIVLAGLLEGVDPRLTVAIAGTESSFGKHHEGYNAWGWDAPNGLTRWSSWEESIPAWTGLFADGYRSGDPDVIGPRYCPDCETWPYRTRLFFAMV